MPAASVLGVSAKTVDAHHFNLMSVRPGETRASFPKNAMLTRKPQFCSHPTEFLWRRLIVSRPVSCAGLIQRWVRFAKLYRFVARERSSLVAAGNYRGPGTDEAPGH